MSKFDVIVEPDSQKLVEMRALIGEANRTIMFVLGYNIDLHRDVN